jgi:hypothetical protein
MHGSGTTRLTKKCFIGFGLRRQLIHRMRPGMLRKELKYAKIEASTDHRQV